MEKVKGFKKLTEQQQQFLATTNARHKRGVGMDYKDGWTPTSVKPLGAGKTLKVTFKNGVWLHYYSDGTWG